MRKYLAALLLIIGNHAFATDSFDPASGVLTLDAVNMNGIQYNGVSVRIKGFDVLGVSGSQPALAACPYSFTAAQFDAIAIDMSAEQVKQIMGCDFGSVTPGMFYTERTWISSNQLHRVTVRFNPDTNKVMEYSMVYKTRSGF